MVGGAQLGLGLRARSAAALRAGVATADLHRLDPLWVYDSGRCVEAIAAMTYAVAAAPELTVGVAVTNTETRHPVVLANALATMSNLSGGRVVCGIGRGDSALKFIGEQPTPLAELEHRVGLIRALLYGRRVRVGARDYRLPEPPEIAPELLVSADGPRTARIAGRAGDGAIVSLAASPPMLERTIAQVRAGAQEAGRDPDALRICAWLHCTVADTTAAADAIMLPEIGRSLAFPVLSRLPVPGAVELEAAQRVRIAALAADQASERRLGAEVVALTGERLLREVTVSGTPEQCREKLARIMAVEHVTEVACNVYGPAGTSDRFALEVLGPLRAWV